MVRRERLVNKLNDLGFRWVSRFRTVEEYKKVDGTDRVFLPMKELLDDEFVRKQLLMLSVDDDEVESFIGANQAPIYH